MRRYAYLREPLEYDSDRTVKIMLCEEEEGVYLFEYRDFSSVMCSGDLLYDSLEDLYDDWNDRIDERGWFDIEDPLPFCQHDAFLPVRIKGRDTGKPQWGRFEILKDGEWADYVPEV